MLHRKFGIAAFATLFAIIGHAQPVKESPAPVFDVVSVKPSGTNQLVSDGPGPAVRLHTHGFRYSGGRVTCDLTLKSIIQEAFSVKDFQIAGPSWIGVNTYDIAAVMPAGTTKETVRLMLRAMLAERFGLQYRREQKDLPVYALLEAKGGFKLHPNTAEPEQLKERVMETPAGPLRGAGSASGMGRYAAVARSLEGFARWLSSQSDAPVIDTTEIKGVYDIDLRWTPDEDSRSEMLKLVERQVGLKLEKRKMPYEVLVVDHVEKTPTEN